MRQYILTDRDIEDFYNIIVAVETQIKAQSKDNEIANHPNGVNAAMRTYRYHLIGWRNRITSGDIPGKPMDYPTLQEPEWLKTRLKQLGLAEEE